MKSKTFAELEQAENVTFEELSASLEDYAAGGWGISARVVKKLVDKLDPSTEDLDILVASTCKGFNNQANRREIEAAGEYQDLLMHLQGKSATKMCL